jgi:ComF family protein
MKKAIHLLKYNKKTGIMRSLKKIIKSYFDHLDSSLPCLDLVVPIPLHRKKLRERGFNQAELIAKVVAKHLQVRLTKDNLKRTKATITQTSLDREERRRNLRKAFTVKNRDEFQAKNVLLVDDVYTTGTTIKEAAKVLKEARVKDVYVFALARAPQP